MILQETTVIENATSGRRWRSAGEPEGAETGSGDTGAETRFGPSHARTPDVSAGYSASSSPPRTDRPVRLGPLMNSGIHQPGATKLSCFGGLGAVTSVTAATAVAAATSR